MREFNEHLIYKEATLKQALELLNVLAPDSILFVVDQENRLIGSLTDGDVRRGLLNNYTLASPIDEIIQPNPHFIKKGDNDIQKIILYREKFFRILPVVDENMKVVNVINFRTIKSYLPLDAVIMAGGRGQRLQPLTNTTPKPLLKVGDKPIMEHNLDRLASYGIDDFWLSVNYLGDQIENYFGSGKKKNIKIEYVWETEPLGTIGSISKVKNFEHDFVLVTNSDLLTNIDYESFFLEFIKQGADMSVLTIPYQVNIPYAVLETKEGIIMGLKEKPSYTYYSNGGVYLMKKNILNHIPENSFFNSTDLIETLIENEYKVVSYPFSGYWLDVGKHEDYIKAQVDINNFNF
jgi:dTDP-glucose pyrophosphorylase